MVGWSSFGKFVREGIPRKGSKDPDMDLWKRESPLSFEIHLVKTDLHQESYSLEEAYILQMLLGILLLMPK